MRNFEKYKTAQERAEAFEKFCRPKGFCSIDCILGNHYSEGVNTCVCFAYWLDLEAEEDSVVIECNGHRYKAKNAKAHLSGDMLVITGCSGVRGDLSAEIRIEKIEQDNRVAKKCMEVKG